MTENIKKAFDLAKWAHEGQKRKFTGKPYFDEHVVKVWEETKRYGATEEEQCAALLHDTVEDHPDKVTIEMIEEKFGPIVAGYVGELTSDEEKLESMGKAQYMKHKLATMSLGSLKVKLADRKCNISDMMTAPDKFRNNYYPETRIMMEGLIGRELPEAQTRLSEDIENILDEVKTHYHLESYRPKLRRIKLYEDFKQNNITLDDIIECIDRGGVIYSNIVRNFPDNEPKEPMNPVSVDDDGLITVEIDGKNYEVDLKDVTKIEYN
jgi:hypothetical protein